MKIELEYSPEELTTLLDGLNNAGHALKNVYNALILGCTVPSEFKQFEEINYDELEVLTHKRLNAIKELYLELLKYE